MPRFISIGLAPAARLRRPSVTIAWASTVAVVVPSPATSLVLVAACLSICAPMFWKWFSSSISLATVTPSWVTVGAPHFLSRATLRPRGPSVTLTAFASASMPVFNWRRASASKIRSLAGIVSPSEVYGRQSAVARRLSTTWSVDLDGRLKPRASSGLFPVGDDREQVGLANDQVFVALELDLGARVLCEQHRVTFLDFHLDPLAVVQDAAWTNRQHRPLLRL